MARRATIINSARSRSRNALLLDTGDTLAPADQTQGKTTIEAMNLMGYDAMVPGERDFTFGVAVFRQRMAEAKFPFLAANLLDASGNLLCKPYVIKEVGGRKIALVGLTGLLVPNVAQAPLGGAAPETLTVQDPLVTAKEVVAKAQKETKIVIVLSHLGSEMDRRLAKEVPGITLILSGHDAQSVYPPLQVEGTTTLLAQAGRQGEYIGLLHVQIDDKGVATNQQDSALITLGPEVTDDPALKKLMDSYLASYPNP